MISEEVIFELQLAKTVMAALRGHYPDLGQTRILDIEGTYQNKDSIEGLGFIGLPERAFEKVISLVPLYINFIPIRFGP